MADDGNQDGMKDGGGGPAGAPSGGRGPLGDLVKAESMIQLALTLPAAVLIGALAGTWVDKHFHVGWAAVAGILLGAAAGFTQIFKTAARAMKGDK
jgi:ATP synthase protein I